MPDNRDAFIIINCQHEDVARIRKILHTIPAGMFEGVFVGAPSVADCVIYDPHTPQGAQLVRIARAGGAFDLVTAWNRVLSAFLIMTRKD